jgi:GT2 family glycosyltransferase
VSQLRSPVFSIIIPTKNRGDLLPQTLASVFAQTYDDWELLVVDDHSTDQTSEQIATWQHWEPRLRYWQRQTPQVGAPACRNEGLAACEGDYVIFLDSDDCLSPNCLAERLAVMQAHPALDFAVFPCQLFRAQPGDVPLLWNVQTDVDDIDRFLRFDPPWQTTSPCWRRAVLKNLGGWNEQLLSLQDWDLHLRALLAEQTYAYFEQGVCFWRLNSPLKRRTMISSQSHHSEHLKSHEALFANLFDHLCQLQAWTPQRQRLMAGLYFWVALQWACQDQPTIAQRVWQISLERDLITPDLHRRGSGYLQVCRLPGLRRVLKKLTGRYLLQGLLPGYSRTFRSTPIGH